MSDATDSWDARRRAQEEQYFQKQNEEALKRIKLRESNQERLSPVSGKPMEQVTVMGVVVDRCADSGGIWLDKGELEQLIEAASHEKIKEDPNLLSQFLSMLFHSKED
jgi:hypothetical protein